MVVIHKDQEFVRIMYIGRNKGILEQPQKQLKNKDNGNSYYYKCLICCQLTGKEKIRKIFINL